MKPKRYEWDVSDIQHDSYAGNNIYATTCKNAIGISFQETKRPHFCHKPITRNAAVFRHSAIKSSEKLMTQLITHILKDTTIQASSITSPHPLAGYPIMKGSI